MLWRLGIRISGEFVHAADWAAEQMGISGEAKKVGLSALNRDYPWEVIRDDIWMGESERETYNKIEEMMVIARGLRKGTWVKIFGYANHQMPTREVDILAEAWMMEDGKRKEMWTYYMAGEKGYRCHRLGGPAYVYGEEKQWHVRGKRVGSFEEVLRSGDVVRYIEENPSDINVILELESAGIIELDSVLRENIRYVMDLR